MVKVMATVFKFNSESHKFFTRNGFKEDETSPTEEQDVDYLILSKKVVQV